MYHVSPLTYFVSGIVTAGLAHTHIICSPIETLRINVPKDRSCREYMASYIQIAGDFITDAAGQDDCIYCPLKDTNTFLSANRIDIKYKWGIVWLLVCYIVFNILLTFTLYWLARTRRRL
jgi:ABC-type multidrug transport system permease subunit